MQFSLKHSDFCSNICPTTGGVPENSGGWPAVCIFPNGTWVGTTNNNNGGNVCEWTGINVYVNI